jgi:hypothetical protein
MEDRHPGGSSPPANLTYIGRGGKGGLSEPAQRREPLADISPDSDDVSSWRAMSQREQQQLWAECLPQ